MREGVHRAAVEDERAAVWAARALAKERPAAEGARRVDAAAPLGAQKPAALVLVVVGEVNDVERSCKKISRQNFIANWLYHSSIDKAKTRSQRLYLGWT